MGIIDLLERPRVKAGVSWSPLDERWYQQLGYWSETFSGFPIGPDTALRVSAVFACTSLIAETLASLPCILYRRLDDGSKKRAREHRLYQTLRRRPFQRKTPMDYFGGQQMHLGLRGKAISEIQDDGERVELLPLHPAYVTEEVLDTGRSRYVVEEPGKDPRTLLEERVLHIRDLPTGGLESLARAALAREAIAVAAAGEAYVGGFFKNDATGRLLIEHPAKLTEEQRAEMNRMIAENYAGWANRSKAMVLTHGVKATELGKHDDSGFIVDPRRFQVADIARFWRVPLFMIGLEEKSTTWGTGIESQKQGFTDFTMKPWTDRWAQAMTNALLDEEEQEEFFIEFLFADLVRGNLKDRMEAYQIGRDIGIWNPNEIRHKENEGPREGGDKYQEAPRGAARNTSGSAPDEGTGTGAGIPGPLLGDAAERIAVKEVRAIERRAEKADEDTDRWLEWLATYYEKHRGYALIVLLPLAESFDLKDAALNQAARGIEQTALFALADGVPDDWCAERQDEVRMILEQTLNGEIR